MSNSQAVPFSVVIPLYNKRPYIRRAVESVLKQKFANFELIVVDDGSTDNGAAELVDVLDPRLKVVQQRNQGVGAARNAGLAHASGAWVAFLDADDAWMPSHLEELHRIAMAHPNAGLISTTCVESVGTNLPVASDVAATGVTIREVDYFLEASRQIGFINATSAAVRSDVAVTIGGFSSRRTGEDLEYWVKVALRHPVAVSSHITCVYFRGTGGVMHQAAINRTITPRDPSPTIRDFSTPVSALYDAADKDPALLRRPSIQRYINGALVLAIKGSLFRGDTRNAKNFSQMLLRPLSLREQTLRFALRAPDTLLRIAVSTSLIFRRLLRRSSS